MTVPAYTNHTTTFVQHPRYYVPFSLINLFTLCLVANVLIPLDRLTPAQSSDTGPSDHTEDSLVPEGLRIHYPLHSFHVSSSDNIAPLIPPFLSRCMQIFGSCLAGFWGFLAQ